MLISHSGLIGAQTRDGNKFMDRGKEELSRSKSLCKGTRGSSPAAQLIDVLTQDFIRNSECMECMDILTLSSGASGTNTQYSYLKLGCKIPSMRDGYFE